MGKCYRTYQKFNLFEPKQNLSLSLFNSEGFFWLTSAISIAFAVEELTEYQRKFPDLFEIEELPVSSKPFIELFRTCVQLGDTPNEVKEKSCAATLTNIRVLVNFTKKHCGFFKPKIGVVLGKTLATYWLIFKLIELEWQEILNMDEVKETYLFLDNVILDHEELEQLEKYCLEGEELSRDDKVYLRSHWQRVKFFWGNLEKDLELLAGGWVKFRPPY